MGLKALREGIFQLQVKLSEVFKMISFAWFEYQGCFGRLLEVFLIHARSIWRTLAHGTFFGIGSNPPLPGQLIKRGCPTFLTSLLLFFSPYVTLTGRVQSYSTNGSWTYSFFLQSFFYGPIPFPSDKCDFVHYSNLPI
jgi:hypothetical protein